MHDRARARQRRLAHRAEPGRARWDPACLLAPVLPELQPAEHLWPVLDEPLANQYFETLADLERAVAERCLVLDGDQLSLGTIFHWWPKPTKPTKPTKPS